jgi:16S rRNA (adenine(1408)-N(1))-methyltransferase
LPNARFVLASAERPPAELLGRADRVSVNLPWGSLLRGVLGLDAAVARGLVALTGPRASIRAIVAPAARDVETSGVAADCVADRVRIADAWAAAGAELVTLRPASPEEIASTGSTWARRLGISRPDGDRVGWLLELRR